MSEIEKPVAVRTADAVPAVPEDPRSILDRRAKEAAKPVPVELPGGDTVFVKTIGGKGYREWQRQLMSGQQTAAGVEIKFVSPDHVLVRFGLCDHTGARTFSDSMADRKTLDQIHPGDILRIAQAVRKASGIDATEEEIEAQAGKSEGSEAG